MYETWFPLQHTCKEEFCEGCLNKTFDFEIGATSKVCNNHNKDPIMKLGLFGHNSLKYCAYFSSPWPHAIITIKVMGNCLRPNIILLHTYNLKSTVFAWSILSWIMHKNSSFDLTNFVLQVCYKFLHDFWCRICFFSFTTYFRTSLLFFPNLDIKSFMDSQIVHFTNTNPHFHTSTFKWCFSFNLLITNWKIPPMVNSLLICHPTNIKKQRNIRLSTINIYPHIYIQKYISICQKIIFHKKHSVTTRHLSPKIKTKNVGRSI